MKRLTDSRLPRRLLECALVLLAFAAPPALAQDDSSKAAPAGGEDLGALLETANTKRGRLQFLQCRACHSLEEGGAHIQGPNLHGLFSREAGDVDDFDYSEALADSGIVWTPEALDAWLARPSDVLPGNRMVFAGIANAKDRADLIAYLQQATAPAE